MLSILGYTGNNILYKIITDWETEGSIIITQFITSQTEEKKSSDFDYSASRNSFETYTNWKFSIIKPVSKQVCLTRIKISLHGASFLMKTNQNIMKCVLRYLC